MKAVMRIVVSLLVMLQFVGEGKVLGFDAAAAWVALDHGPIPGLMPPMRMRFNVQNPEQLQKLKIGDLVRFALGSRGEEITIVTIELLDQARPDPR